MYKVLATEIWKPNGEEFKTMFFEGKTRDTKLDGTQFEDFIVQ